MTKPVHSSDRQTPNHTGPRRWWCIKEATDLDAVCAAHWKAKQHIQALLINNKD